MLESGSFGDRVASYSPCFSVPLRLRGSPNVVPLKDRPKRFAVNHLAVDQGRANLEARWLSVVRIDQIEHDQVGPIAGVRPPGSTSTSRAGLATVI